MAIGDEHCIVSVVLDIINLFSLSVVQSGENLISCLAGCCMK